MEHTKEAFFVWNWIEGEVAEIENIEAAKQYVNEVMTDGDTIHPEFESFAILKHVGNVHAEIENGVCKRIVTSELPNSEVESLRETVKELREALGELVHLHMCEQEGLSSGRPSPEQWLTAVDKATAALTRSNHLV